MRRFAVVDLKWLAAFLAPESIFLLGMFIQERGWLPAETLSILRHSGGLLVVLSLMRAFGWRLTDLGVKQRGLRPGLLAAGLLFFVYAVPQWFAAYPFRWQPLGWVTAYWATFYLLVGVTEELWMRGLLYTALRHRWSRGAAIVGTSLAFGLVHIPGYGIWALFGAGLSGVAYGLVRARTGNLLGLILAHWLLDLMDKVYVPYNGTPSIGLLLASVATLPVLWLLLWRVKALADQATTQAKKKPARA